MSEKKQWESMTIEEKNIELYRKQVDILDKFLVRKAVSQDDYDRIICELNNRMLNRNDE